MPQTCENLWLGGARNQGHREENSSRVYSACEIVLVCFEVLSVGGVREQLISEKNFLYYDEGGVVLSLSN